MIFKSPASYRRSIYIGFEYYRNPNDLAPTELRLRSKECWLPSNIIIDNCGSFFRIYDDSIPDPPRMNSQIWFSRGLNPNVWCAPTRTNHTKIDSTIVIPAGFGFISSVLEIQLATSLVIQQLLFTPALLTRRRPLTSKQKMKMTSQPFSTSSSSQLSVDMEGS